MTKQSRQWLNNRAEVFRLRLEFKNKGNNKMEAFRDLDVNGRNPVGYFLTQREFIAFTEGMELGMKCGELSPNWGRNK